MCVFWQYWGLNAGLHACLDRHSTSPYNVKIFLIEKKFKKCFNFKSFMFKIVCRTYDIKPMD
jgi:hypothetical protein